MKIGLDIASVKDSRWYEYAVRFLFGGLITAATGLIAKKFGPEVAGLFLAFPAIFPASATLVEKHEREKKEKAGLHGTARGRQVASVDSAGAAIGSIGLVAFGLLMWKMVSDHCAWLVFGSATLLWLAVSVVLWMVRKSIRKTRRKNSGVDSAVA